MGTFLLIITICLLGYLIYRIESMEKGLKETLKFISGAVNTISTNERAIEEMDKIIDKNVAEITSLRHQISIKETKPMKKSSHRKPRK